MDRINEMMRRDIGEILQREIQDPRLAFVTITAVKVTADLQQAWVSFSFLGQPSELEAVKKSLHHAKGFIRHLVAERVQLRHVPELDFVYDESIAYGARIEQTLEEIKREMPFEKGK